MEIIDTILNNHNFSRSDKIELLVPLVQERDTYHKKRSSIAYNLTHEDEREKSKWFLNMYENRLNIIKNVLRDKNLSSNDKYHLLYREDYKDLLAYAQKYIAYPFHCNLAKDLRMDLVEMYKNDFSDYHHSETLLLQAGKALLRDKKFVDSIIDGSHPIDDILESLILNHNEFCMGYISLHKKEILIEKANEYRKEYNIRQKALHLKSKEKEAEKIVNDSQDYWNNCDDYYNYSDNDDE